MNFKDCIDEDLNTFVNQNEFAETVTFNNQKLKAVLSRNTADLGGSESAINGVHSKKHSPPLIGDLITIYFKLEDLQGDLPKYSEFVKINGVRFKVVNSQELQGLVRLSLSTDRMQIPRGVINEFRDI